MQAELANRIREARTGLELTQAELAAIVGVSRKTINTLENQAYAPSAALALKLARALGSTVEHLFYFADEQPGG